MGNVDVDHPTLQTAIMSPIERACPWLLVAARQ
jgi:hypothetical protein